MDEQPTTNAAEENIAERAHNEDGLRIGVEKLLEPALQQLGIVTQPRYDPNPPMDRDGRREDSGRDTVTALHTWSKMRERHTRQRVLRLNAVANTVHSAATLIRPRKRNLRPACCSLIIPNTGSTICFLSL